MPSNKIICDDNRRNRSDTTYNNLGLIDARDVLLRGVVVWVDNVEPLIDKERLLCRAAHLEPRCVLPNHLVDYRRISSGMNSVANGDCMAYEGSDIGCS